MRILIDTNILLSAMWFKKSRVAKTLLYVTDNHERSRIITLHPDACCQINVHAIRSKVRD